MDDDSSDIDSKNDLSIYSKKESQRKALWVNLNQNVKKINVSGENVFQDLMKIYTNDKSLHDHTVSVQFKGELTNGDSLESMECPQDLKSPLYLEISCLNPLVLFDFLQHEKPYSDDFW